MPSARPWQERLMEKVSPCPVTGCWWWTGGGNRAGYGNIGVNSVTHMAHRLSWMMHRGPIPPGMHVLHRCDQPSCVNPAHLFAGTVSDNMNDKVAKNRHAKTINAERIPRGDAHWTRRNPDAVRSGCERRLAKLTAERVREIRARHANGERVGELARAFGVGHGQISLIVRRKQWAHVD